MPFPNAGIYQQTFTFRDAKGFTATTRFYINAGVGTVGNVQSLAQNIQTALDALTNAHIQSAGGAQSETGVVQYGAAAQYLGVEDKAVMVFQSASGLLHHYAVPAPKVGIFLPDMQTIDPGNASVISYVTAMLSVVGGVGGAQASGKSGDLLINFFGGLLRRGKTKRRYGILQLTPALTPEEPGE